MTSGIQAILHTFDALPDADNRSFASEILRRSGALDQQPFTGEQLTAAVGELFQQLDDATRNDDR